MQRLGQHFLKNTAVVHKIIAALDLQSGETVIEIGPGKGALTLPLVRQCQMPNFKCQIVAVEKDKTLAGLLTNTFPQIKIIEGDILKILPKLVIDLKLSPCERCPEGTEIGNWKLLGNIPYYITGKLLRTISELNIKPSRTVLMIQKEVAERLTATPGKMNLLAAAVQVWADVSVIARLKPEDFDPPPKVESAVIRIETKKQESPPTGDLPQGDKKTSELAAYYKLIHAAFKQPRKTLLNNLSEGFGLPKNEVLTSLQSFGFTEKTRAQELGVEALSMLSKTLQVL
ncbi:MAG: ribosomal RNA small subunit methyltransferase A [Candidatus Harrisonbacteria bacterium]|nr:ribosomal RNA small subunit methyltransferase A [Candidatus Harrisonbacteria bacterium]